MDWDEKKIKIIDGWSVEINNGTITLSAQFYANKREEFPVHGDKVPTIGINAVPSKFIAYRIRDVQTAPVTSAGPYIGQVTAVSHLQVRHGGTISAGLITQVEYSLGYTSYTLKHRWCGLKRTSGDEKGEKVKGIYMGNYVSALDKEGKWDKWKQAYDDNVRIVGSPFSHMVHPRHAGDTKRFLQATATFYKREGSKGLSGWGGFAGIVPVRSMPNWLKLPGGDNRWRLYDENIELVVDNDGKTKLLKVTRVLLGIPNKATDADGKRLEWEQDEIGQRDWDEL